jgi:translocation and assembly module TamB
MRAAIQRTRRAPRFTWRPRAAVALACLLFTHAAVAALDLPQRALDFLVDRVVARTGGRLKVEGATGSPASRMRFARLTWTGDTTTVTAEDVLVEWSPRALLRAEVEVRALGARRIAIAVKPSPQKTPTTPPTDLSLPLTVSLQAVSVRELEWQTGPRAGTITGLAFAYRGNADEHVLERLQLGSEYGALSGNVTLGAKAPLPVGGTLRVNGAGKLAGVAVSASLGGTLGELAIDTRGTLRNATLAGHLAVTPFASAPLARADVDLAALDLSAFDAALPATTLDLSARIQPQGDGFAGTARLVNERPGPIDRNGLPFVRATADYAWRPDALDLRAIHAELAGGGQLRGDGRVPLGDNAPPSTWTVMVSNVDPAALHTRLLRTRVSGSVAATAGAGRQTVTGTLRDATNVASFSATIGKDRVDVATLRLASGDAVIAGSGSLGLTGKRAYSARLTLTRFDPSRFAAVPAASLDGRANVTGTLEPRWTAAGDVVLADTSRYDGQPLAGHIHGAVAWPRVRDLEARLTYADTQLTAQGNAGAVGDRLEVSLVSEHLDELARLAPASAPVPLAGRVEASGILRVEPGGIGGNGSVRASGLRLRDGSGADRLALDASVEPGGSAATPVPPARRRFEVKLDADALHGQGRAVEQAAFEAHGTLADHTLALDGRTSGHSVRARATGSATLGRELADSTWRGRIEALDVGGRPALHLRSPAGVELARERVHVADAHVDVAGGRADVIAFDYTSGRIATEGSFTGIDVASALAIAEQPPPFTTTLVLGGDWSISAAPRLNGHFSVRRERGDVFVAGGPDELRSVEPGGAANGVLALGISALEASGTLRDDALDATATLRSVLAGNATGTVTVGAAAGAPPGRFDRRAPLRGHVEAHLASLTPFAPFLGTQALLRGRADASLDASGTVGDPVITGTLRGDQLVIDAPRYGVHVTDGVLVSRLAERRVIVEELSVKGGDGRFTAQGVLALPGSGVDSRLQWHADAFRVANSPTLRLVLAGDGTVALTDKRLQLAGRVQVQEGHVEYEPSPPGQLGDDVVVIGWRSESEEKRAGAAGTPALTLDLAVDLGEHLTFTGEGLDAALTGRVTVVTGPDGTLRGRGTIRTLYGTYYAFGQRLTVDRGRLIFDGPLANPALDVLALRKNLPVEAGVEVTGTVKVPQVRITSNPPVSENEALAWLITGQGLSGAAAAGNSLALLSAASGVVLGSKGKPLTTRIAERVGLTDISLESSGTASGTSSSPLAGQVVVLGKRISDRLTIGYEQGLALASSALRIEYALTRTLTLRAEAGASSSLGLVYRRLFQ